MHPSQAVMVATHDKAITVGHDFNKISTATLHECAKTGCSICNSHFAKMAPKGKETPRPAADKPVAVMDSFGPVAKPSIHHGYTYASSVVLANGGFITTHGSKAIPEPVLEETMNEFRATIRPFVGDVVTIRTDSIRQTTTAKRWQRYVNGPAPVVAEHSIAGKHWQVALIERFHGLAWPMTLAGLKTARRGLEWWWVAWKHAVLMVNIQATRRDESLSSRWVNLYQVPFNVGVLRVILSTCQYYID